MHFSCHGEDVQNGQDQHDGYLLLEHESGDQDSQFGLAHSVAADAFSRHLQNHDGAKVIEFVFVSACHSLEVGKKFEAFGIKHVIAVDQTQKIKDVAAQRFSKTLYRMLFSGSTVKQAFDQAKLQLSSCDDIDYNGNPVIVDAENQASRFRLLGAGPHDRPLDFIRHLTDGQVRDESLPMSRYLPRNENFKIQPRQEELFRLMKQMTHMQSKLMVVHGPPSIGKSSLLLESVRYMSARGRQLAWIPCSESSPEVPHLQIESFKDDDFQSRDSLCSFIGRTLGIPDVNNFNDLTQHRGRLARSWVVFDGAENFYLLQKLVS